MKPAKYRYGSALRIVGFKKFFIKIQEASVNIIKKGFSIQKNLFL